MAPKEPSNLLEAIVRIAKFSYEPSITKYPFLKEYLKKEKDPEMDWVLWVTAAGAGYALSKKEAYPGEHDELINSAIFIEELPEFIKNFAVFIQGVYKNNKDLYSIGIGFWILTKIKGDKPSAEELNSFPFDIGKLIDLTIEDYEKKKIKD
jgi:hypothetical protein